MDRTGEIHCGWRIERKITGKECKQFNISRANGLPWLCRCTCGCNELRAIAERSIINDRIKGCKKKEEKTESVSEWWESYIGKRFGTLEVIGKSNIKKYGLECSCKCGCESTVHVTKYDLDSGHTKSCGRKRKFIDLTGMKFGTLTVKSRVGKNELGDMLDEKRTYWLCECSCGNIVKHSSYWLRTDENITCRDSKKHGINSILNCSRSEEQLEYINNSEKLKNELIRLRELYGVKPRTNDVVGLLGVRDTTTAMYHLKKHNLVDYVEIGKGGSGFENDIVRKLGLNINDIIIHDRRVLDGNEIDIYIPSKKIGIEANGVYWHSDIYKEKTFHQEKSIIAHNKGIRLIHIFEDEWYGEAGNKVRNYLKKTIYGADRVIGARECNVRQIDNSDGYSFCEKYHLQGKARASITYGMFLDNEIVAMMSFGKPRFEDTDAIELIRYAVKDNIVINGGAEKLFKCAIHDIKCSIITYCDIGKFSGEIYKRLGFKYVKTTAPDYRWVRHSKGKFISMSRYETMKDKLVKTGLGTAEMTEDEIMRGLGFLKVYGSGNKKYIYSK